MQHLMAIHVQTDRNNSDSLSDTAETKHTLDKVTHNYSLYSDCQWSRSLVFYVQQINESRANITVFSEFTALIFHVIEIHLMQKTNISSKECYVTDPVFIFHYITLFIIRDLLMMINNCTSLTSRDIHFIIVYIW